jgi:hypothetical protein
MPRGYLLLDPFLDISGERGEYASRVTAPDQSVAPGDVDAGLSRLVSQRTPTRTAVNTAPAMRMTNPMISPDAKTMAPTTVIATHRPRLTQVTMRRRREVQNAPTYFLSFFSTSPESAAMNASWGTSTRPTIFMRFLPSFCFSSSLRLRVMSPP